MRIRNTGDLMNGGMAALELGQNGFFDRPWKNFNRKGIARLHLAPVR
jgi:hypothetical protein